MATTTGILKKYRQNYILIRGGYKKSKVKVKSFSQFLPGHERYRKHASGLSLIFYLTVQAEDCPGGL